MSASFGTAASKLDKTGSFQHGSQNNGKLKTSISHLQLQFQDSTLSPALALLPAREASLAENSIFQKSDAEFRPLSASPDFSAGHESDESSPSQNPSAQETETSAVREASRVSHVSSGSRSTQPDAASRLLYRELLAQSNRSTGETSQSKIGAPGSRRDATQQSYVVFLPRSQSTPALSKLPAKSAVKPGQLSVTPSGDDASQQVHDANPLSDVSLDSEATAVSQLGGASSSVVSLDVDNYAPYWTSQPATPSKRADLNIEDRIPLYLQKLGIEQSPADILSPFAPGGPIREPEFSPTELSTIKDSAGGTPMKSAPSSEAGSPPKVQLSDSGASLAFGQDDRPVAGTLPGQTETSSSSADASQPAPASDEDPLPPALEDPRPAGRVRASLFVVRSPTCSEEPGEGPAAPSAVGRQDHVSPRRAEPEGCSAAPRPAPAVGPPPDPDEREPASLPAPSPDEAEPVPEDPEDPSSMSDDSGRSSLTVRVAKLLRGGSPSSNVSNKEDHAHKKRFVLKLSEGRFDTLQLNEEDRRCIDRIKAAMLAANFVTSDSSTDTESTAASGAAAAQQQTATDQTGARTPVLPEAGRAHPEAAAVRDVAGADIKVHTSITIAARKRPAATSCSPPPEPLPQARLDARKSSPEAEGSANEAPDERDAEHVAEDTTAAFSHVSRAHLTLSPKPPEAASRVAGAIAAASSSSSSSSSSLCWVEPPGGKFVPLRRSSPAVSSADEGGGRSGPPPRGSRQPASAPPPHPLPHLHHQSVAGNAMRSYTPETPVRDECASRAWAAAAAPLRPYKPRGAEQLFYVPRASSSCTSMESSHTGADDAVPPAFAADVLGRRDPGLDRGVDIKHAEGIYSKRSPLRPGGAVASEQRFTDQRKTSVMERLKAGGGVSQDMDQSLLSRDAWLQEQLQRLCELILATRGTDVPPATNYYDNAEEARRRRPPCPADRDESSASTSTLDTGRLVRAFGARRVQSAGTPKSGLRKLYGDVAKQRERWEGRSFNPIRSETDVTADPSNVTGETSSTGSYAKSPPYRSPKKPVGRTSQEGEVEIALNATRLYTRDVGTMFPPPAGRARRGSQKAHVTSLKYKKAPTKLPKAVWWFIPLDELSKENRAEEDEEPERAGPGAVWYDRRGTAALRAPLRLRQPFDDDADDDVPPRPAAFKSYPHLASLQEALLRRRPDIILRSRQRAQILNWRKMSAALPGMVTPVPERAVPRKEMMRRTKQLCQGLPEVLRKLELERRDAQLALNRLNLQIYNKRRCKRRLENRKAGQQ